MRPIRTAQSNVTFGDSRHGELPAQRCHAVATDGRDGQEPMVLAAIRTIWSLDLEERTRIANGADIELIVLGERQPIVLLKTTRDPESTIWEDRG